MSHARQIVLLSCTKKKREKRCEAREMYVSTWSRYALKYAQSLRPDRIFFLSAKYGLVDQETVIKPYDETLNNKSDSDVREWANSVVKALREQTNLERDTFIILAGKRYRKHLLGHLKRYKVPMAGLGIGQQLRWLKKRSS